jgi:ABC-type phosphate transport system substrate-binding protein
MTSQLIRWRVIGILSVALVSLAALSTALPAPDGADTDPTTLVGEGGSFLTPVTDVLLKADSGLAPLNPTYEDANLDNAVGDFAGTAPGTFSADFVVSERPLTSTEAATAEANGRAFAYVPFAATPVAVATLAVCNPNGLLGNSTTPLCKDIPLTVPDVALLFTSNLTSPAVTPNQGLPTNLTGWGDPRLTQANDQAIPQDGVYQAQTLEPSAENTALLALLDSDPTAKELLDNALNNPGSNALTQSDTPSETWPFHGVHAYVGGDAGLIGKELNIDAETNAPSVLGEWGGLGAGTGVDDVFPLSSVWAGAPEGTPWNIPMAAVQNAAGTFVPPSTAAAASSESDATLDPATNLVTFAANAKNTTAYNSYLMVESYLVVPTTGLTAAKAQKLAQYIRFVVGPVAQSDETTLGSAPPTPAMVTADLKVANELDQEAATASSASSTDPGGSATTTTTSAAAAAAAISSSSPSGSATGNTGNSGGGTGLAATGASNIVPAVAIGGGLVMLGVVGRRRFRRLRRPEALHDHH